jgi:hypothetical protein
MTELALVCDMSDAADDPQERLAEYARLFATALIASERSEAEVRWRLRAAPGVEAWARDLAARENACCAFMHSEITSTGAEVVWSATTIDDPRAKAALDFFYELPQRAHGDADAVAARMNASGITLQAAPDGG